MYIGGNKSMDNSVIFPSTLMRVSATYGGRKMSPRQVSFRPSAFPLSLLHDIDRQIEGKVTSTWTMWSSRSTAMKTCHTEKDTPGISVIAGIPSKGSSLQQPRHCWSGS